uniref:hypothetical protein n=1 Tax=Prevotella sp. TaxID=59823 RepID=UPI00307A2F29
SFGLASARPTPQGLSGAPELYVERLKKEFKYVTESPLVLTNNRGVPIFHFVFASNNQTAVNIAQQIIKKKS